jgi:putative hemolysin
LPLLVVRRNPEQVLAVLLPSFHAAMRVLGPITALLLRMGAAPRERPAQTTEGEAPNAPAEGAEPSAEEQGPQQDRQARELLRSLVDFRDTMVREVMTPRPDIVAVSADATLGDLLALFRDQQYSRVPVYKGTLDNILGFIFVKDLIQLKSADPGQTITPLVRPAYFVPETKRVPELLREFQRNSVQSAIVVDEYGGIAGLVTIEDLLEEIVGEIRDEYDVETERMQVTVEGEGFETVGGYLLAHLGRVPVVGETFEVDALAVEVLEAERRRINRVRIRRREVVTEGVAEPSR